MRTKGSQFEYAEQRDEDFMRAYREQYLKDRRGRRFDIYSILADTAKSPAKRFWVSETRAYTVISAMYKGISIEHMLPQKKAMFKEIFRRVDNLLKTNPSIKLQKAVRIVIHQTAPCFYITDGSARIIFFRIKKKWKKEGRRK